MEVKEAIASRLSIRRYADFIFLNHYARRWNHNE
jgi:hypothetical protein